MMLMMMVMMMMLIMMMTTCDDDDYDNDDDDDDLNYSSKEVKIFGSVEIMCSSITDNNRVTSGSFFPF